MKKFVRVLVVVLTFLLRSTKSFECGVRKVTINKVIVRGQDTSPGDWPWHAAIYHRSGVSDSYACGGTLLSERFVLTAVHCVEGVNGYVLTSRKIFVRLGVHNLRVPDFSTWQQHELLNVHRCEDAALGLKNDIAILELSTLVKFTSHVQPACVNLVKELVDQFGTAVGWGITEDDEVSSALKAAKIPVVSTNQCLESNGGFRLTLDSSVFCAGYLNGTTVCNGDSGGGLHFERKGVWYVGGIVSFTAPRDSSLRCQTKSYAGFTSVYHFLPWIQNVTQLEYLKKFAKPTAVAHERQRPKLLPQDCGKYLVNKIVRGTTAKLMEFPWVVLLVSKNESLKSSSRSCLGSLISNRYVLTSGSCISSDSSYQVLLGEYNREQDPDCSLNDDSDCAPPVRTLDIEITIRHPQFNEVTLQNNIALIRLRQEIIFEDHIQPICLPLTQSLKQKTPSQYIVTGWGHTKWRDTWIRVLQKAVTPSIALEECKSGIKPSFYVGPGVLCADRKGTAGSCREDLGGPMGFPFLLKDVRFVQYGITSLYGCGDGPSVYTNVAYYVDWIIGNMVL
ncbi:serine protease grass-like [Culex pipiens pallens]|uniref:serine protease grass-like n=1 Tax=Culex pipiens pallens TaxID=42434 RepID=UPI0022AA8823|nr:serine protease grass-like [Culex pipiens pallens]